MCDGGGWTQRCRGSQASLMCCRLILATSAGLSCDTLLPLYMLTELPLYMLTEYIMLLILAVR